MKKILFVLVASVILMYSVFLPFAAVNAYPNEPSWFTSPEYEDVYTISSASGMYEFIQLINDGCDFFGKTVCLTESVTLLLSSGAERPFRGSFNGLGNTIYIRSGSKSPLFSELDGAEIRNFTVTANGTVTLLQGDFGAPVAISAENTLFDGIRVTGRFEFERDDDGGDEDEMFTGMIAGYAGSSTFVNCVCDVTSGSEYGSFAGAADFCGAENCFSGGPRPFTDMNECDFDNVMSVGAFEAEGVLGYGNFALADDAVRAMNAAVAGDPDYNYWLVERSKPYVHLHTAEKTDGTPATCVQKGQTSYVCTCGKTLLECTVPMTEHTYSDEGTVVEPTCTEEGYTLHICTVCGHEVVSDRTPKADHVTELVGAVEPTCSKRGYTGDFVCINCGKVIEKGMSVRATGQHEWGNMEITKEPTVDKPGYVTMRCVNCNAKTVEEIPALGHVPLEYTYFDEDQHRAECTCGEEYYFENHKWDAGVTVKEATADEDGEILYTCTVCGTSKTVAVAALGHDMGEWQPYDETYHAAECSCGELHKEEHEFDDGIEGETRFEDGVGYKSTLYTCIICGAQKTAEEKIEAGQGGGENPDLVISPARSKITAVLIAVFAILFVGGVAATVFIRKSDVK